MKRKLCASVLSTMLLGSSVAHAADSRFAIGCTGMAVFADNVSGKRAERTYALPRQIYVLDKTAKTVARALIPRQQYDVVCFRGGHIDTVTFSPGLISVTSEAEGRRCDFSVDRKTGDGEYFSRNDLPNDRYTEIKWTMNCSRTNIPVFDSSKNRF